MIFHAAFNFARFVATLLVAAAIIYFVTAIATNAAGQPGFFEWLGGAFLGNFGMSSAQGVPAGSLIAGSLGVTMPLLLLALLLALIIGAGVGWLAGRRPETLVDQALMGVSRVFAAVPPFWLGLLLVLVFALTLRWLPSGGFMPWLDNPAGALASLVLPALAVALPLGAMVAQSVREALTATDGSGFMLGARARGLTTEAAFRRHGWRNMGVALFDHGLALLPQLIVATLIVESVFYLPGLGRLLVDAVAARDVAVARGLAFVLVLLIAGATFLLEMGKGWVDPRLGERRPA